MSIKYFYGVKAIMIFSFVKILILILTIVSCSSINRPSFDMIRPWSQVVQSGYPAIPFVFKYQSNISKLYFIAADHSKDLKSPTHQIIKETINDNKVDVVIIEGVKTSSGANYSKIQEYINRNQESMNEASYTAKISAR